MGKGFCYGILERDLGFIIMKKYGMSLLDYAIGKHGANISTLFLKNLFLKMV